MILLFVAKMIEKYREKENSEAGNRTPVVRVTGGNTKPLYYFGTVLGFYFGSIRTGLFSLFVSKMSSRNKSNLPQRNYCHICMETNKLSIRCDNVVKNYSKVL